MSKVTSETLPSADRSVCYTTTKSERADTLSSADRSVAGHEVIKSEPANTSSSVGCSVAGNEAVKSGSTASDLEIISSRMVVVDLTKSESTKSQHAVSFTSLLHMQ